MTNSEFLSKYFALSDEEIETLMAKFLSDKHSEKEKKYKEDRLTQVLNAICPYCEQFLGTDEKIKHKVGVNLLTKFNFNNFDEELNETYLRLNELFIDTTARNINPYKIIYSGVLTDGNLRSDYENDDKFYDKNRDFVYIYKELCETLNISEDQPDEQTRPSKIFEKCSTLISKVYANNIYKIYDYICNLRVDGYKVFREKNEKEVTEILKNNPSLFSLSTDKIKNAFNYLRTKIKPMLEGNLPHFYDDPEKNKIAYEVWILRNWLKNNSSLLNISAETMFRKENSLRKWLGAYTSGYQEALDKLFKEPVTLGILDKIKILNLDANAVQNVVALEKFVDKFERVEEKKYADVSNYIVNNPYFLGINREKFKTLLEKIGDYANTDPEIFTKFLNTGRTLFASNTDIAVNQILNKLLKGNSMVTIDVDKLSGDELITKFNEIFNDGDPKFQQNLQEYIDEREKRDSLNEKKIRKSIRQIGEKIKDIPKMLKEQKGLAWNISCLNGMVERINTVNQERFLLAGTDDIFKVEEKELKDSNVENIFNKIRDIYEQKRFKVGKKYIDSDKLFEKTITYLSQLFDDKEAIEYIFRDEISKPFVEILKEHFNAQNSSQIMLMGKTIEVPKIENKRIEKTLKNISNAIKKGDSQLNIIFDK